MTCLLHAGRRCLGLLIFYLFLFSIATPRSLEAQTSSNPRNRGIAGTLRFAGVGGPRERIEITLLNADRRPVDHVFADSLGGFQFLGLPPGGYYIVVDHPDYRRIDDYVEIPIRSLQIQRRYYLLEPRVKESAPAPTGPSAVAVENFVVSSEAKKFLEKGQRELGARRYAQAGEYFDRAIAIEPRFEAALSARGLVYLQLNDLAKAGEYFERALAENAKSGEALLGLGAVHSRMGESTQAVEILTRALAFQPRSYLAYFERCRSLLALGEFERAEKDCSEADRLSGGPRPELHVLLGNLYLRTNRNPEALREFERFLDLAPKSDVAPQVRALVNEMRKSGVKPN